MRSSSRTSFRILVLACLLVATVVFPWLRTPPAFAAEGNAPIPTQLYQVTEQEFLAPDWSRITWSNLPPIQEAGAVEIPSHLVSELGYDPSRTWQAGSLPEQVMMLGDLADAFAPQQFSLQNVSDSSGLALSELNLKDFGLSEWQTANSLVEAIPELAELPVGRVKPLYDLFRTVANGGASKKVGEIIKEVPQLGELPLGKVDLSQYDLDSIPGLAETPIEKFSGWQESFIAQVPGLSKVPFSLFPITPGLGVGQVALVDVVWSAAEYGDPQVGVERFVSGTVNSNDQVVPVACKAGQPCAYLELSDLSGAAGSMHGMRWASGKTQKVKGGYGVLAQVNNGWEPAGLLPFGPAFKVAITGTDETTGTASFGLYFRVCIKNAFVDLGCTPYFIGPIPWIPAKEKGLVILSSARAPQVNVPQQYQEQMDEISAQQSPAQPQPDATTPTSGNGNPPPAGKVNQAIANSVKTMGEFSSRSAPGTQNGKLACVWAVNQVLVNAGLEPLANGTLAVRQARAALQNGRGAQIRQSQAKAGDITIVDAGGTRQHIGICLNDGCTKVKSNSSSRASFSWISGPGFKYLGSPYNSASPEFWRVKQ